MPGLTQASRNCDQPFHSDSLAIYPSLRKQFDDSFRQLNSTMSLSRRRFLHIVGVLGGSSAAYQAAIGLGITPVVVAATSPDIAPLGNGVKKSVLILGAGIASLVSAYELLRRGYDVTVLEASHRVGGRVMTIRGGDLIDEVGNPQVCNFDREPHLYFNAGASRIAGDHAAILDYCRQLKVELEPFVNMNRDAWVQDDALFGGKRVRNREYVTETRNFIAELAAKSIKPDDLDMPLTPADHKAVLEYLHQFGRLNDQLKATRSKKTVSDPFNDPAAMQALLNSKLLGGMSYSESDEQIAVMLTPVGGMDRIVTGFMNHVGAHVRTETRVDTIRLTDKGVEVECVSKTNSELLRADFCINSIPMQLLSGIKHNFPPDYARGLASVPRGKFFKLAFQAKERFWERENIYGGISWTMQEISQMWYPSHGIHKQKGVILGAYTFAASAGDKFARLSPAERLELAKRQGEKLHPGYSNLVEHGVSVCWHRINHMLGCAAAWNESLRAQWYKTLREPVGRHYLVGDQISDLPSWQEGAVHSAFFAIADIDRRVREQKAV
jgi:monoamine oxidase